MFAHYFRVAFRNFWRNKIFSGINILGLSIGISSALVLFLIAYYEFSFDRFEKDRSHIYRVVMEVRGNDQVNYTASALAPLAEAASRELTGLENVVPLMQFQGNTKAKVQLPAAAGAPPDVYKSQPGIIFTSQQYFSLLPYQWLAGSAATALSKPFAVVLTQSRAEQYFPGKTAQQVIGKTITYNDSIRTTVAGVVHDLDEHTFFNAAEFISLPTVAQTNLQDNFMMHTWNDWMSYSQLFIQLSHGTTQAAMEKSLNQLLHRNYNGDAPALTLHLQPLSDVHFQYETPEHRTAHKPTLFGLLAIAAFLLLLGCINFINLTTAHSAQRAREIGIRKTMGSMRPQLVTQFLCETLFITTLATMLSIGIMPLLLNIFRHFIPDGLHAELLQQPSLLVFLLLLTLGVSFLAGFYPAMVLSGFKPVKVLKNQVFTDQTNKAWVRKTLTVSQFVIAQFFVIATVMVSKQIHYSLQKDLGFRKDAIVNFSAPYDTARNKPALLLQKIKAIPEIQQASLGFLPPATDGPAYTNILYNDGKQDINANVQIRWGDTGFLRLYNIQLVAGRNVLQSDTIKEFLVNETYARIMHFTNPAAAVGHMLLFNGKQLPIVGVMHDFHEQSLHGAIGPIVFAANNSHSNFFHILLYPQLQNMHTWTTALAELELVYKQVYPDSDFEYRFFDEEIARFYAAEQQTVYLLKWATGLAILISCLGLFGLVIFTTTTRKKEIGIRKVLGASVVQIVSILSTDFLKLVLIAFLIAAPAAWWAVYHWLQDFAYRTTMSWWVFALCGVAMLVVALLTLSLQTIRAAMTNPVKSLRTE
ncbi:ABC transporter permease [Deminuibacter soli]|uniref:ABC transporter permease n=1 Tax=Deminuibacter soli TaxID=2291815 RepID=A0A3E1NKD9_9BACT|nr:ABC transporter permease [Deminuibacter soli]RFM28294.1 ABC transporter permease [Deminuibacter soli]